MNLRTSLLALSLVAAVSALPGDVLAQQQRKGPPGFPFGPGGPGRGEGARAAAFENEARPKDDAERKLPEGIETILQKLR